MKLVLYLNGGEGLLTLETALKHAEVACIVLPEGRENPEILKLADDHSIKIVYRGRKDSAVLQGFEDCVLLSSAFPFKIMKDECDCVSRAVNFHAAILPKYRGLHGSAWALINDEDELGVTVHEIDDGFDSGTIISMKRFSVLNSDDLTDIQGKASLALESLLVEFMMETCEQVQNIPEENIYWRARTPDDSQVNWHMEARKIFVFVRALSRPATCAWTRYNSHKFNIEKVEITGERYDGLPGRVILKGNDVFICSGDGLLLKVVSFSGETKFKDGMVLH